MPTLNRFPLLGLWAREAARRAGYRKDEAESLGHAYAVLYAIRAARRPEPAEKSEGKAPPRKRAKAEQVRFGGDDLDVVRDEYGHLRGRVGGEKAQTPRSFLSSVVKKFPPDYYDCVCQSFQELLKTVPPRRIRTRLVYDLYDEWKRACAVGRLVDLDKLVEWCRQRTREALAV